MVNGELPPKLQADVVRQIVESLRGFFEEQSRAREGARFQFGVPLRVLRSSVAGLEARRVKVWSIDISTSGIGFLSPVTFECGEKIIIELRGVVKHSRRLEASVMYVKPALDGLCRVGAHFEAAEPY